MMNRLIATVVALLLAAACCPCAALLPAPAPSPAEGVTTEGLAPDFTLERLDGGTVTLSDLHGQVVVLDFWATWCGPCEESMPYLQDLHDRYSSQGVVVLAVNQEEGRDEVARYISTRGYTFVVLLDRDGAVGRAYGVWGIPYTVVIDPGGAPHTVWSGPQGAEAEVRRLLEP